MCNKEIKPASGQKMISIRCPTCHTVYSMAEGASEYTCPLCDSVIDVSKEIAAAHANAGATSLIEYDPGDKDWIAYKHPIQNFANGSQLIVRPGQQALLIEAGEDSHLFGPGQYTMDTANFPWMENIYRLSDGDTKGTFQSSIYYFNLRTITNDASGRPLEWFVKKTPVNFLMRFEGSSRPTNTIFNIGCGGTYDLHVEDSRKLFLNLNSVAPGLDVSTLSQKPYSDSVGSLSRAIKGKISSWGGEILVNLFSRLDIGIFEIDANRSVLAQEIEQKVNNYLEKFGLKVSNFLIDSFATPEDDPGDPGYHAFISFRTMASSAALDQGKQIHEQDIEQQRRITQRERMQTAKEALGFDEIEAQRKIITADAEARIQKMEALAETEAMRAKGFAETEVMRAKGFAESEVMRAKGYSAKDVIQADVQKAYAQGLGNMGPVVSTGGSGIAADILGFGVGMSAAQTMAPQIAEMMSRFYPSPQESSEKRDSNAELHADLWDCPKCGTKGNWMKFCPCCGSQRPPEQQEDGMWDCPSCGQMKNTAAFCPACGSPRPEKQKVETWDCKKCGKKGISSNFCPECGAERRKDDNTWNCTCGENNIISNFCPSCGHKRNDDTVSDDSKED